MNFSHRLISMFRSLGPNFGLLFSAGLLSDIGGFATHTAFVLYLYKISGESVAIMGVSSIASLFGFIIGAPIGGAWAERYNRKWIMMANDAARIPVVMLFLTTDHIGLLLVLLFLNSAFSAMFMPSRNSIIPEIVSEDNVHLANSVNGSVMSVVHLLGPVLGGFIFAQTGSLLWVVVLDAASYGMSFMLIGLMAYAPTLVKRVGKANLAREIYEGFVYVRSEADLRYILLLMFTAGTAIGLLIPLLRPFVGQALRGDDRTYAILIGMFGLGGFMAPLVGVWAGKRFGYGRVIVAGFALEGVILLVWSRIEITWLSYVMLFIWGLNEFTLIPCYMSYLHKFAKKEFLGRTFALLDQAAFIPQMISAVVIVWIGDVLPTQSILSVAGIGYMGIVLITFRSPGCRLLRERHKAGGDPSAQTEPVPAE